MYWKDIFIRELPYCWELAVAVDMDGTLCGHCYPEPPAIPNIPLIETLKHLKKQGVYIIIHSCRMTPPNNIEEQRQLIFNFCIQNDIPFDMIWDGKGKPIAAEYVDDSALKPEEFIEKFRKKEVKNDDI